MRIILDAYVHVCIQTVEAANEGRFGNDINSADLFLFREGFLFGQFKIYCRNYVYWYCKSCPS